MQIANVKCEREYYRYTHTHTHRSADIQEITRTYYEELYGQRFNNLQEVDKILKKYEL